MNTLAKIFLIMTTGGGTELRKQGSSPNSISVQANMIVVVMIMSEYCCEPMQCYCLLQNVHTLAMTTAAGQPKHQLQCICTAPLWIYRHCTLIELLWARVALFFVVREYDLTMNTLHDSKMSLRRICKTSI